MFTYVKNLIQQPKEIYTARNMKNKHFFFFLILIGFLTTLLSAADIREDYNQLRADYQEIQASIPTYEIVDGELESDAESYIYQTDSLVFYFDAEGKITQNLIDKNMKNQHAPMSFALQKDRLYLNVLGQSRSIKYSRFDLAGESLQSVLNVDLLNSPFYFLLILFILFWIQVILYASQLFTIAIFANLISFIQQTGLTFIQNAKIALMASIIPTLIFALLNTFNLSVAYASELTTLGSLFLFYLAIDEFKKRLKQHQEPDSE